MNASYPGRTRRSWTKDAGILRWRNYEVNLLLLCSDLVTLWPDIQLWGGPISRVPSHWTPLRESDKLTLCWHHHWTTYLHPIMFVEGTMVLPTYSGNNSHEMTIWWPKLPSLLMTVWYAQKPGLPWWIGQFFLAASTFKSLLHASPHPFLSLCPFPSLLSGLLLSLCSLTMLSLCSWQGSGEADLQTAQTPSLSAAAVWGAGFLPCSS